MEAIGEKYGVSRHQVRRWLVEAGEPTRPPGRPRLHVSSKDIAELYESGLSWDEISERLVIHPAAARTRYDEIRAERGERPYGRWHRVLLTALGDQSEVVVLEAAAAELGRRPNRNEAHGIRRAARDLARAGDVELARRLLTWDGRRAQLLVILKKPGSSGW